METRTLKFRAWDGKKMSKSFLLEDAAYEGFPEPVVDENGDARTEPITFLQWTGLLDKNGKEVFEGDFVEALGKKWLCKWQAVGFWFVSWPEAYEDASDEILTDGNYKLNGVVVGNIYEDEQ